jgi:predicted type IV restriction endonuclease
LQKLVVDPRDALDHDGSSQNRLGDSAIANESRRIKVPSKLSSRLATGIKKLQPILALQQSRDVNEADTAVIVTEILSEVFGYDKFTEITSEHEVHKAYCDKAIRVDGQLMLLVEVKAIGAELKDQHVRQVTDYAAKQGVDWVVLTNAIHWRVYKMLFSKPVDFELVFDFNFCELDPKSEEHIELLSLLARESWHKDKLDVYEAKRQVLGKFSLAAVILSEPVLKVVRRTVRNLSPGIMVHTSQIADALRDEVLKREVLEGDKADAARKMVRKLLSRGARAHAHGSSSESEPTDAHHPLQPDASEHPRNDASGC